MTLIILEGADCAGKTTLAKSLETDFDYKVIHHSWSPTMNVKTEHWRSFNTTLSMVGHRTVFDRHAVSELVYGLVFRKGPSYDVGEMLERYSKNRVLLVHVNPGIKLIEEEFNKRKETEMFDSVRAIHETYCEVFDRLDRSMQLNTMTYDYTQNKPRDVVIAKNTPYYFWSVK
jgi:thymidylate kinase